MQINNYQQKFEFEASNNKEYKKNDIEKNAIRIKKSAK